MDVEEKYPNKDIQELSHLFFEMSGENLVPALNEHFMIGLAKFKNIQENEPYGMGKRLLWRVRS